MSGVLPSGCAPLTSSASELSSLCAERQFSIGVSGSEKRLRRRAKSAAMLIRVTLRPQPEGGVGRNWEGLWGERRAKNKERKEGGAQGKRKGGGGKGKGREGFSKIRKKDAEQKENKKGPISTLDPFFHAWIKLVYAPRRVRPS